MKGRQLLLGLCGGVAAGYATVRTLQAWRAFGAPITKTSGDASRYGKARRALMTAGAARALLGTVAFAYGPLAKTLVRAAAPLPRPLRPAVFFATATCAGALADMPIEFVEDYVLERAFGLTDQSKRSWFNDALKGTAIGGAIAGVIGFLGAAAVRRFPRAWPFAASLGLLPLLVLANVIVPLYILPMFNTFTPLRGPLEERLRRLASRFGVGDAEILRMDMSKQTRKANAFVAGVGNTHRIVLGDTLIDRFEPAEVEFVVAHELGHYVTKDTWRMVAVAEASAALLFFVAAAVSRPRSDDETLTSLRIYALLAAGLQLLRPAMNAFSRSREWAADRFALAATHDASSGIAAFRRLRDQNLAEEDVPAWFELLFGSHPSLGKRITALEHS